ncbi:MAG TPA: hypothetical protein VKQ30_09620 [Ktedonobacterales bacterium]|nr:hypothetical protein [Ktedonobacterales bacterium]
MDSKLFQSLEWRCIGPHRGGRVVAVAGHPTEKGTFYFGGSAGGVWKTTSGGALWENISDGSFGTAAIGAIAVSDSDPNVIYVGTGESTIRGNVSHGDGVYTSTDGGKTWRNTGLADTRHIGDIVIHPRNPNIAYVAALGHAWGPNAERGVYRTTDGGATWQRVLFKSERAGAVDLAIDPHHPDVLYATIWQTRRYPHALQSGGEDSGLWKSTDGGETWTDITRNKGLPKSVLGKIGVAASPAQPGRVWALFEAAGEEEKDQKNSKDGKDGKDSKDGGGLFRSDDWGVTWERINTEIDLRRRPWYYMHVYADPQNADTVWILNLQCWKSTDGGKTFTIVPEPHGDNHDLWIDPRDSHRMIEAHDGGANVTFDGGHTWSSILNQPTAQLYHVTTDDRVPYNVYASQQDNWAMRLPSLDAEGAISWKDYTEPGGGESGYIAISRKPPYTVFGGGIGTGNGHGRLLAWNPDTGQRRNVTVWPEVLGNGVGAGELKYRFQWTFPVEFSPHDPDTLYACSNFVHRTTNGGASWETISTDLTRNDPEKLGSSGGPITADNSGAEIYCTIFAFRESPHEKGVFWTGSDDGLVHLSRDGGQTWHNVTPPDLPDWALISIIELSPHDAATAYVAATRYKHDDLTPYLYKTTDYGATWTRITSGIPSHDFTRVIREDPNRRGLLYAGTETGLYISFDDGANWQPFQCNLPVVPIHDLVIKGTDLIAATHGRSIWILDDLSPLYHMSEQRAKEAVTLFAPRDTTMFRYYDRMYDAPSPGYVNYKLTGPVTVAYRPRELASGATTQDFLDAGKNPPNGVIIHYALAEKPESEIKLAILDAEGKVIREFSSKSEEPPHLPAEAGANRFVWNYRYARPTALEDATKKADASARLMEEATAPRALPGEYTVRLTVGETIATEKFTVLADPRLPATAADLRAQFDLKLAIRDLVSELHQGVNQIRRLRKQVESWGERAKAHEGTEHLSEAASSLIQKLTAAERALVNLDLDTPQPGPNRLKEKLATLSAMADESDDAPTQGAHEVFVLLQEQTRTELAQLRTLIAEDVTAFNEAVRASELPPVGS